MSPGNVVLTTNGKNYCRRQSAAFSQWGSNICNSDGYTTYRIIKYDFKMEKYLLVLPPNLSRPLCKFRTCSHPLSIQQGR